MGVVIVDSDKMVGGSHNVWVDEETDRGLAIWSVQSQRVASTLGPMRQVRSTPPPVPGAPFRPSFPHISSSNPTPMPCVCYASSSCSSSPPFLPNHPRDELFQRSIQIGWADREVQTTWLITPLCISPRHERALGIHPLNCRRLWKISGNKPLRQCVADSACLFQHPCPAGSLGAT